MGVLILVLVEDGLRDLDKQVVGCSCYNVLILVLVEDGLRALTGLTYMFATRSLNPCSCGGWSQRKKTKP